MESASNASWLEKQDFPRFCRVSEDSAGQSRYRYQIIIYNFSIQTIDQPNIRCSDP